MSLQGKRILITAGPTWVAIDSVRVISNIATGETGILLAREASARGARVTLVLGPGNENNPSALELFCYSKVLDGKKSIRLIHFRFFNELRDILKRELKNNKFDIIIHSAAVSDFRPEYKNRRKLSSGKSLNLKLVPLPKLVVLIRQLAQQAKLVMFKLELVVADKILILRAKNAKEIVGADLVVANCLNPFRAFIIDKENNQIPAKNKQDLARRLINVLLTD